MVLFSLPNLYGFPCIMCHVYDEHQRVQSHGGIAVRSDFQAAAYAAIHEAAMQYITYYAGSRDDYTPFAPMKNARIAYANAAGMYFDEVGAAQPPVSLSFKSIDEELQAVIARLKAVDIEHILVADTSPLPEFQLCSVKVIVPRLELWFCPKYQPSPTFAERVTRLKGLCL
jgi:ribosomal protein S12 methylthiotransferase accessory factor YcaO